MFENIIDQAAAIQLRDDIISKKLAHSMLFFGPPASGKGSAALELARALSCEGDLSWKCSCTACAHHRYLQHNDLLILGPRQFSAEIAASSGAFLREPGTMPVKILFIRSLRKLMARFSPALMEGDPKLGKLSPILQSLEEGLNEFEVKSTSTQDASGLEKLCKALVKDAHKLETEGIGSYIPIAHIRAASYWCRLAPNGRRKTFVIENADNMRDEGRNSLLKLLEEPPGTLNIVLTAKRREAIMETLLSRLRPYRFLGRDAEKEKEVIRRVFRDSPRETGARTLNGGGIVSAYLDSFLPQSAEKLYPLAAFFWASLARCAAISIKKKGAGEIPAPIAALGERYAPIAETAGFGRSVKTRDVVKTLLAESGNFEEGSISRFLSLGLDMAAQATRGLGTPLCIAYNDMFRKYFCEAQTAAGVLNQSPALAMEALFFKLQTAMAQGPE